jgi:hypothetical protein
MKIKYEDEDDSDKWGEKRTLLMLRMPLLGGKH